MSHKSDQAIAAPAGSPRRHPVLVVVLAAAIVGAVVAAFWPAASASFTSWDDDKIITENHEFRGLTADHLAWMWTTGRMGHYQPLTWMSLALDYLRYGLSSPDYPQAAGFHRTSIALHAIGALALFWVGALVLRRSLSLPQEDERWVLAAAALAACLHAVHPLRCESVCWVTERRDVLAGVFFLVAVGCYLRSQPHGAVRTARGSLLVCAVASGLALVLFLLAVDLDRTDRIELGRIGVPALFSALACWVLAVLAGAWSLRGAERHRRAWFLLAHGALLVSLLAKSWGMAMPMVLFLLDLWPLARFRGAQRGRGALALLVEKLPSLVLAMAFARLAYWAQSSAPDTMKSLSEHALPERCVQALYGLCFYPAKTLAPIHLSAMHELPARLSVLEMPYCLAAPAAIVITLLAIARARQNPAASVAWSCYLVIVLPVLGLVQSGPQLVAERYSYLSCIPFALLAAGAGVRLARRSARWRVLLGATAIAAIAVLIPLARAQSRVWQSSQSLWEHAYELDPRSEIVCLNLGVVRMSAAREQADPEQRRVLFAAADRLFGEGLQLRSDDPKLLINMANLRAARALVEPGLAPAATLDGAIRLAQQALALAEARKLPLLEYSTNYGMILHQAGQLEAARAELERAVQWRPAFVNARLGLGMTLLDLAVEIDGSNPPLAMQHLDRAIAELDAAIALDRSQVSAWKQLANAWCLKWSVLKDAALPGEREHARAQAIRAIDAWLELAPDNARAREQRRQLSRG